MNYLVLHLVSYFVTVSVKVSIRFLLHTYYMIAIYIIFFLYSQNGLIT